MQTSTLDEGSAEVIALPDKFAYVYDLGDTGIQKVGKTNDLERRKKTFDTISTAPPVLRAKIATSNHTEVENFIKGRLQADRWLEGPGKDLYQAPDDLMDKTIEAARQFSTDTLPRITEAEKVAKERSDGSTRAPELFQHAILHLLHEWRQRVLVAEQEMRRLRAELMLYTGSASSLEGIATFESQDRRRFDAKRFELENPEQAAPYMVEMHVRPFNIRW
jgi:hypothetical protein